MRILQWLVGATALFAVAGCGGGGGGNSSGPAGQVSGLILDFNGDPVRGARVWINNGSETDSNSSGSFVLEDVERGDWKIRAEIEQDGVVYEGENTARVFSDERTKSVQITVLRSNQTTRVRGVVLDNEGFELQGVQVFAIPTQVGGVFGSSMELTDSAGTFDFDMLRGNTEYKIIATGVGYNSDADIVNVAPGGEENLVLTLKNPTDPLLPAPTGLEAVTWTTPSELTRSPQSMSAIQNLKKLFDPRTPTRTITRDTIDGNWIESDLFWDSYPDNAAHIGFGIYRRLGTSGSFSSLDFLRDTEAENYIDLDANLQEFETWSYYISAVNTSDPTINSESDPSNVVQVETLGDLYALTPLQGPLRFRWDTGSGADEFIVYVFDEYPGIGVEEIWSNESARATGTQVNYSGPSLQSGQRYYYMILGLANGDFSRTVSRVESFISN